MTEYVVIYEQAGDGSWSAHTPDLPVYATGATRDEARREIRSALALHLDELRAQGERPPAPAIVTGTVSV